VTVLYKSASDHVPPIAPIIPIPTLEPITEPGWVAELKLDGFCGLADTINARMSKNLNPLKRFHHLLNALPLDCVFDGEICVVDQDGKPDFNALLFGRNFPVYVVFDLLFYEREDIRSLSLRERRGMLDQVAKRYGIQKSEMFIGCGRKLYETICRLDLEGIIAKKLDHPYDPGTAKWWKVPNAEYTQKEGREKLFERRAG
jgi:bifunctional non-homologous end joining protein LigD